MPWLSQLLETITTYEWWQIILIILAIGIIPVVWRIDPNKMLESFRGYRERKRHEKAINDCFHAWVIYPASDWAKCSLCYVPIRYSNLLLHNEVGCCNIAIIGKVPLTHIRFPEGTRVLLTPHNKRTKKG